MEEYFLSLDMWIPEDMIARLILSGLSAIDSFAQHNLCHGDIKLRNMAYSTHENHCIVVLIDFGSVTKFGGFLETGTRGMSMRQSTPSIGYDVTCLASSAAHLIMRKVKTFSTRRHLLARIDEQRDLYPTVTKMMDQLPIDQAIDTVANLRSVWKSCYELALPLFGGPVPALSPRETQ
jgi:serine/threonine protein kinase